MAATKFEISDWRGNQVRKQRMNLYEQTDSCRCVIGILLDQGRHISRLFFFFLFFAKIFEGLSDGIWGMWNLKVPYGQSNMFGKF